MLQVRQTSHDMQKFSQRPNLHTVSKLLWPTEIFLACALCVGFIISFTDIFETFHRLCFGRITCNEKQNVKQYKNLRGFRVCDISKCNIGCVRFNLLRGSCGVQKTFEGRNVVYECLKDSGWWCDWSKVAFVGIWDCQHPLCLEL